MTIKLVRFRLAEEAAKELRKMILDGDLKPGEHINEGHIAKQMDVSRGPIREALLMLKNEGIVTLEVNKGATVSILSEKDAYETYTLRAFLEVEAVTLGIDGFTEDHFASLQSVIDKFQMALKAMDFEELILCDTEFHRIVVNVCDHSRLIQMHRQLDTLVGAMFLTTSSELPIRVNQVVEIHQILLESLRSRDIERISNDFRQHYLQTLQQLKERFKYRSEKGE